jgi:uncharacterized Rmd1/YagE family protein
MKFFHARQAAYHTSPRIIDEVIYTPYVYDPTPPQSSTEANPPPPRRSSTKTSTNGGARTGDLLGIPELHEQDALEQPAEIDGMAQPHPASDTETGLAISGGLNAKRRRVKGTKFTAKPTEAEIFIFKYGTVVIWGMTEAQEKRFLSSMFVGFRGAISAGMCLKMIIITLANGLRLRSSPRTTSRWRI